MTCEIESGRQAAPARESGEAAEAATCGMCGGPVGERPKLHIMREVNGQLEDMRVCPVCFLSTVMEGRE